MIEIIQGGWRAIKSHFVRVVKNCGVSITKRAGGLVILLQLRLWENTIKNDDDFRRCVDYCYINPVNMVW